MNAGDYPVPCPLAARQTQAGLWITLCSNFGAAITVHASLHVQGQAIDSIADGLAKLNRKT